MKKVLKIATRKSPLAVWQADYVQSELLKIHPNLSVELVKISTEGDRILDTPLAKIGGKGLFIKELEQGMLAGIADIAVHSMKDVPMSLPTGFKLAAICKRDNPFDAFVSNKYHSIDELPQNAIVGTSSLRRKSQLLAIRPDVKITDLRGNINTRLNKLDNGDYDAIILASAGLIRLGMQKRINSTISSDIILPAIGQGAVGIEILSSADVVYDIVAPLNCIQTSYQVHAERAMSLVLNGGCQVPIGGFATLENNTIRLEGLVASVDGKKVIKSSIQGHESQAVILGTSLGRELLSNGADKILQGIY